MTENLTSCHRNTFDEQLQTHSEKMNISLSKEMPDTKNQIENLELKI